MNVKISAFLALFMLTISVIGQEKKQKPIICIDGVPSYESEFISLFGKNKASIADYDKQSLKSDIQLFIDYKLKLKEAKKMKLDTSKDFKAEVQKYRKQLARPYLSNPKYIDSLVQLAYKRMQKEIRASHILVRLQENSSDTLAAYNKISKFRDSIIGGADFNDLAFKYSEDPSAKKNKGDLGYFTAFKMVSEFEDKAYNTPVGQVSDIFKTSYGYHFLKTTDLRDARGEMEVYHLMIGNTKEEGKKEIDKLYQQLLDGEDFSELAKKYSNDSGSAKKGGRMGKFTEFSLPKPFGTVSFALTEENPLSEPFKTDYGWHIVKYLRHHPVKSFEESKKPLTKLVKRKDRSVQGESKAVAKQLKKKYKAKINQVEKDRIFETGSITRKDSIDVWLVAIENDTITLDDFSKYNRNRRHQSLQQNFSPFVNEKLLNYHEQNLDKTNLEFRNVFNEYKDGLLMFDLMKLKIWDAAQQDTLGLQKFYNVNHKKYATKSTVNALIASTREKDKNALIQSVLSNNTSLDSIKAKLSNESAILVKSGEFEKTASIFPKNATFENESVKQYVDGDYAVFVKIVEVKESIPQTFVDVKGKVISDYQNKIQTDWINELRSQHTIKIRKWRLRKTLKKMKALSE